MPIMCIVFRFEQVMNADDDSTVQNVPELYLEPIRVSFTEPDFSILDPKPSRPARPEVGCGVHNLLEVLPIILHLQAPQSHIMSPVHMNGRNSASDDPFSNQSMSPAEANTLFNNDDAFAAFNGKTETVGLVSVVKP